MGGKTRVRSYAWPCRGGVSMAGSQSGRPVTGGPRQTQGRIERPFLLPVIWFQCSIRGLIQGLNQALTGIGGELEIAA